MIDSIPPLNMYNTFHPRPFYIAKAKPRLHISDISMKHRAYHDSDKDVHILAVCTLYVPLYIQYLLVRISVNLRTQLHNCTKAHFTPPFSVLWKLAATLPVMSTQPINARTDRHMAPCSCSLHVNLPTAAQLEAFRSYGGTSH